MSKKKKEKAETKEIVLEHVCSKCGYDNRTKYDWPIKVYEQSNYEFEISCTQCGKMHIHKYEEETKEIEEVVENLIEELIEEE